MSNQAVRKASTTAPSAATSPPDSDVSPRAQVSPPVSQPSDYFSVRRDSGSKRSNGYQGGVKFASLPTTTSRSALIFDQNSPNFHRGSIASSANSGTAPQSPSEQREQSSRRASEAFSPSQIGYPLSRKSSVASVTFRPPQDPNLPQGVQRKTDGQRLRASSPQPVRFRRHVGFDNLPVGEATKFNTSSLTLNVRHQGYHPRRRSRTFMVGVDEHAYSDYALVWLLENLVDDGDEVVCVRVIETPLRGSDKGYQDEAKKMMQTIQEKNTQNRAISIVLEYSVGKLHATFQQLIQIYQPSMLIVGTRGRSLGGIQGLVNNRNSFSKYCLQYSPVPVVVVRPDEKRKKKKDKRSHDPSRQSYISMLSSNEGIHEADKGTSGLYETETQISPEEEAHRVAAALGLPAAFDPTIKPLPTLATQKPSSPASSVLGSSVSPAEVTAPPLQRRASSPPPLQANDDSGDEDSGGDEDEGFDVVSGQQALKAQREREELAMQAQKERLHRMEVGEAAALLKSVGKIDEEDEDQEDEDSSQGSGSANRRNST